MGLLIRALIGAFAVVLIAILSKSKNYFIAALVPLFPTFGLIAHYTVGIERSPAELKTMVIFGMWCSLPYYVYLLSVYFLIDRMNLAAALTSAVLFWFLASIILVVVWMRVSS